VALGSISKASRHPPLYGPFQVRRLLRVKEVGGFRRRVCEEAFALLIQNLEHILVCGRSGLPEELGFPGDRLSGSGGQKLNRRFGSPEDRVPSAIQSPPNTVSGSKKKHRRGSGRHPGTDLGAPGRLGSSHGPQQVEVLSALGTLADMVHGQKAVFLGRPALGQRQQFFRIGAGRPW
jgi:hypothetical protein